MYVCDDIPSKEILSIHFQNAIAIYHESDPNIRRQILLRYAEKRIFKRHEVNVPVPEDAIIVVAL